MFEQCERMTALGVVHGFTTREGGVSQGRYASLNMGGKWGDDPERVRVNRMRVAEAAGFSLDALTLARQVHGVEVVQASACTPATEADAVWCHRDDGPRVVAVLTADCVPVLLVDEDRTVACAIHSGWRGTVAGVVSRAVAVLRERGGVAPSSLLAAIGPCIEREAFEVGEEVAARFAPAWVDRGRARPHVDLVAAVRAQLVEAGVRAEAVQRVGGCTLQHPDRYFSFRRDGAGIGQMMSFVAVTP